MIACLTVGTHDLDRATLFYHARPGTLGMQKLLRPGVMFAFEVDSAEQVDATHAIGIELGGENEGYSGPHGQPGVSASKKWRIDNTLE